MGKMKELFTEAQQGYYHDLKLAYVEAVQRRSDTVIFNGREISKAYAEYLLQFEDTFLKPLADDNIRNTDDKSERFL
jgi:hypothetical protein|tara:strand:- start:149 stop:379 length:231 start_codon:yes stop_codon:yes gene_type:complete